MPYTWTIPGKWSHAGDFHQVEFGDGFGKLIFQDGPIAEHGVNGTTNEEVLSALIDRLKALNTPPFSGRENAVAITHLETALLWLQYRTQQRQQRGVEGTGTP